MSFFSDTKNVGLMMFIIAVLGLIRAVLQILNGATCDGQTIDKIGFIIIGIGALLGAIIFFKFGNNVRTGAVSGKLEVVAGFVQTVGYQNIVASIFLIVGGACVGPGYAIGGVVLLILGAIILYLGKMINDGKKTLGDKVLWIALVVVFFISMLACFAGLLGSIFDIIYGACSIIMYLCILVFMFDKEIKDAML